MSAVSIDTSPEEHRALERFYFHEARLLDNRQYTQWLALLSESVRYVVPSRVNVQVNNRDRGNEEMLHPDRELEGSDSMGAPLREEGYGLLMLRAEREVELWRPSHFADQVDVFLGRPSDVGRELERPPEGRLGERGNEPDRED